MKKKNLRAAGALVLLAGAIAPMAMTGCGDNGLTNPLDTLCCTQFKPGADMSAVDWGLEGDANVKFGVTMQAIGDFSGTATAITTDLGTLCRNLAVDLGEDPKSVTATESQEFTKQWCAKAVAQIATIKADLTIAYQPAECSFSAEVQASCEGKCQVDASCDPGSVEARCSGGEVTVKCEGSCSGSCSGSANVAVSCEGECSGACEGTCMGTQNGSQCQGTCNGKCRGECSVTPPNVSCEGECHGSCTGTATAPKCTAKLDPPMCEADVDCRASCDASASAKAECTPPAVTVEGSANLSLKIAALKKYLPEIILIGEKRAPILSASAEGVISASANIEGGLDGDGTAALCIVPAALAIADAGANIKVTLDASASVLASIQ